MNDAHNPIAHIITVNLYLQAGLCSRESCEMLRPAGAGIPRQHTEGSPDKLSLALEPESAAIYCHGKTQELQAAYGPPQSLPGSYLVVDIGGGTVDISAYRVAGMAGSEYIEMVQPPTGNEWGGTQVNKRFKEFLEDVVGDKDFSTYLKGHDEKQNSKHQAHLIELINQTFERQKTIYGDKAPADREKGRVAVRLPATFATFYLDALKAGVSTDPDVELVEHSLRIKGSKMETFFKPVLNGIHACIMEAIQNTEGQISTIYLVGGFGGSKYVYDTICSKLGEKYTCLLPHQPRFSVVLGAVLFGRSPDRVHARRVDATYGIRTAMSFNPTLHRREYLFLDDDNIPRCRNIFSSYVERGDHVCTGEVFSSTFHPVFHNQKSAEITVFCSLEKDVWYTTGERGPNSKHSENAKVYKIGTFSIEMPNLTGDKARPIEVTFDFSHTEIQVKGYDVTSGNEVKLVVDFLSCTSSKDPILTLVDLANECKLM